MENNLIFGIIFISVVVVFVFLHFKTVRKFKKILAQKNEKPLMSQMAKEGISKTIDLYKRVEEIERKLLHVNLEQVDFSILKRDIKDNEAFISNVSKQLTEQLDKISKEENALLIQENKFLKKEISWYKNQQKPYPTKQ